MSLVLIRGIPGSGKSTMAKKLFSNYDHFEADMFFLQDDGSYKYDRALIGDAHRWCQSMTKEFLINGCNVVVTNTFVKAWELYPYLDMAELLEVDVTVLIANNDYSNIHGTPEDVVARMKNNFELYYYDVE